jgi:very-short-patch-repair endonuclease
MAAVLACGKRAWLSWLAAAMHLEFMRWEERLPDVTVVATTARRVEGIRVHRARSLHWRDTMIHKGIPVTSPARTLLDLAVVLSPKGLRTAARRAQATHRVSVRQLREVVVRSKGHPGCGALWALIEDGPAPTRSDLEDLLLDLLDNAGIPRPEVNAPLRIGGRTIIPDFLWRDRRFAIEADSRRWHEHKLVREEDAVKQAILESCGWRVLRVDEDQMLRSPAQTVTRIRGALEA